MAELWRNLPIVKGAVGTKRGRGIRFLACQVLGARSCATCASSTKCSGDVIETFRLPLPAFHWFVQGSLVQVTQIRMRKVTFEASNATSRLSDLIGSNSFLFRNIRHRTEWRAKTKHSSVLILYPPCSVDFLDVLQGQERLTYFITICTRDARNQIFWTPEVKLSFVITISSLSP